MADITITIPNDKIPMLIEAIKFHTGESEMTPQQASDWVKLRFKSELRLLVRKYQEHKYNQNFLFDDIVPN